VRHTTRVYRSCELQMGFKGKSCSFEWRPFAERSPAAQRAYKRLKASLHAQGMRYPLITYKGHVLIGQRRFEIMRDLCYQFECIEILEPVEDWTTPDIDRLTRFKESIYPDMQDFIG
jgi:hypothetical protein